MNEELKIIISAQIDKLKQGVNQAKGVLGTFKSEISKNKETFGQAWNTMGQAATKASEYIVKGVAGIGTALMGTSALTAEYREQQAMLATAFEAAGASADVAKSTYDGLVRVLGDSGQATEAAGHLAKLTTEEQALSEWTTICQGVYATFGESLPIESLTEAANETAKTGELTGALADALNWAGISEDAFSESLAACNSEAEREQLIRETLTGLYSDAAAAYEENNAAVLAQNEANAQLQASLAQLGAAVQPVLTMFTQLATDALAVVIPYIQQLAQQYGPMLSEAMSGIASSLAPIGEFIVAHLPALATIAGLILTIAAAYQTYTAAVSAYNAVKKVYTAVTAAATAAQTAFAAANIAALAPVLAIIAAIAAVVAIIVLCVKHWDEIKAACGAAWDFIKEKTSAAVEAVSNFLGKMRDKATEIFNNIKEGAKEKFTQMKETMSTVMEAAKSTVQEKLSNIKAAYEENGGGVKGVVAATMEAIKGYYTAGYTFINTLTNGKLGEMVSQMKSKLDAAKSAVVSSLNNIKNQFQTIFDNAKQIVSNAVEKCKSLMNFSWSLPKLKLPHISISGSFSLNPPSVPKFSISWYKLGGVFDSPTLFGYGNGMLGGLGENGAEAVVPLEKNTMWLDRIATMLNEKQGNSGNRPIYLMVDGRVFGEIAVDSINELTRLRGNLPLKLV